MVRPRENKGFTLLEVLIASALLAIVLGAVAMIFISMMRVSTIAQARLITQQDLRDTLDYISRLIRFAGIRPVETAVEEIGESYILFQCDYDNDGVTDRFSIGYDAGTETITLTQWVKDGPNFALVRPAEVVMERVKELLFTYYTEDNEETANPDLVTGVQVTVALAPPINVVQGVHDAIGNMRQSRFVYCPNLAWRLGSAP